MTVRAEESLPARAAAVEAAARQPWAVPPDRAVARPAGGPPATVGPLVAARLDKPEVAWAAVPDPGNPRARAAAQGQVREVAAQPQAAEKSAQVEPAQPGPPEAVEIPERVARVALRVALVVQRDRGASSRPVARPRVVAQAELGGLPARAETPFLREVATLAAIQPRGPAPAQPRRPRPAPLEPGKRAVLRTTLVAPP